MRDRVPGFTFQIIGDRPPAALRKLADEESTVELLGWVDDVRPYLAGSAGLVVPLRVGSGMRVKILEGMALGKVIITTSMGMEGIEASDKEHLLIADSPEEFVRAVGYCKSEPEIVNEIGQNAVNFVGEKFNNKQLAVRLYEIYKEMSVVGYVH